MIKKQKPGTKGVKDNNNSQAPSVNQAKKLSEYGKQLAEKALHEMGHENVKTVHGPIETSNFYRLPDEQRLNLRKRFNIPADSFIIGFVFRNQLRNNSNGLDENFLCF